jgi:hypothetical protein
MYFSYFVHYPRHLCLSNRVRVQKSISLGSMYDVFFCITALIHVELHYITALIHLGRITLNYGTDTYRTYYTVLRH